MAAAGCRKNANFGVGSNPWGLDTPETQKNSIYTAAYGSHETSLFGFSRKFHVES